MATAFVYSVVFNVIIIIVIRYAERDKKNIICIMYTYSITVYVSKRKKKLIIITQNNEHCTRTS